MDAGWDQKSRKIIRRCLTFVLGSVPYMSEHTPMPNAHSKRIAAPSDVFERTPSIIPIFEKTNSKLMKNPVIFGGSPPEKLADF